MIPGVAFRTRRSVRAAIACKLAAMAAPRTPRRPFNEALGRNLKMARLERGISLEDATRAMNARPGADMHREPSAVGHYEVGRRACPVEVLAFLAELYDVPFAQLLPGGDPVTERMQLELRAANLEAATLRGVVEMATQWMRLAKATNPELSQLDVRVKLPLVDPDQLED